MKIREKTKARLLVAWVILSLIALLATFDILRTLWYGTPVIVPFFSLLLSVRRTFVHADMIDRHIKMMD